MWRHEAILLARISLVSQGARSSNTRSSIHEVAFTVSVGKTLLCELLVRTGVASIKLGRRRLIPHAALEAYLTHRTAAA